jgi:Tfp pilus assembly protein PilX
MSNMSPENRKKNGRQRGAALILTVVVIMVLTTLALAMATFTITEERTATTYRDGLQTRALAEAGIRVVQEMFRSPNDNQIVPKFGTDYSGADEGEIDDSLALIGVWRKARIGASPAKYSGMNNKFFQGTYQDTWEQVFGGSYSQTAASDRYDLKFDCTDPSTGSPITDSDTKCWLDAKINALLTAGTTDYTLNTGKITDISFYAPPNANGDSYGLATVRVTATKFDSSGTAIARETMEAVIIDNTPKPAVLGNGDIIFKTTAGVMCGDGCEQIYANGNATVGTVSGGPDPMVTASGTITGGSGSTKANANKIAVPEINPWDLAYKPKIASELNKYYLASARQLDAIWTDNNIGNNIAPRPCGVNNMSLCQDYTLEFTPDPTNVAKKRTAASVPYLYKWDSSKEGWTECSHGNALNGGVACPGAPTFSVAPANDLDVAGTGDTNDMPYNTRTVPQTTFDIGSAQVGATVLVDGRFTKNSAMSTTMTIIAVGSIYLHASSTWAPAMSNRSMWIAGRDLHTHSNCCAPSNTCATNLGSPQYAGILASHEQILEESQNALLGLMIAENRVNFDPEVNSTKAIDSDNGDHGSLCGLPPWPWAMPITPGIASIKSAAN